MQDTCRQSFDVVVRMCVAEDFLLSIQPILMPTMLRSFPDTQTDDHKRSNLATACPADVHSQDASKTAKLLST